MKTKILLTVILILTVSFGCMQELLFQNPNDPANERTAAEVYKPKNLKATDGLENVITVSWDKTNNAAKYMVFRSDNSTDNFSEIAEVTTNKYEDMSATQNTNYYYKVKAELTTKIITEFSNVDGGYRTGSGSGAGLSAPTNVVASDGTFTNKIRITWEAVTGAEKYFIYRCDTAEGTYEELGEATNFYYEDGSFTVNKKYYYKIKSWSQAKQYSDFSANNDGYILSIPKNISATDGEYLDKITITWDLTNDAPKFYIYRSDSIDGAYLNIANVTVKTYNDTTVTPGNKYYYKIKSNNLDATSDFSISDSGYRKLGTPVITASKAAYSDRVEITFNAVIGATSYDVYRSGTETGTYTKIGSNATNSYNDVNVVENDTYYYKVIAYSSSSDSYSDESNINAGYILGTTSGVTASDGTDTGFVTVSWSALSLAGATKYYIYRSEDDVTYSEVGNVAYTTLTYNETSSIAGIKYYYKIRAKNATEQYSEYSPSDTGYKKLTTPSITVTDGGYIDKIAVIWSAINGSNGYDVYRATSSGGSYTKIGYTATNIFNDTTVDQNSTYYYKIQG